MNIIIPSSVDEKSVKVPMEFPLKPDADKVVDANGRIVLSIDSSIEPSEAIKFAKLFALAPELFQLLGESYAFLGIVAKNSGTNHGEEGEDKDNCLLCQIEAVLDKVK